MEKERRIQLVYSRTSNLFIYELISLNRTGTSLQLLLEYQQGANSKAYEKLEFPYRHKVYFQPSGRFQAMLIIYHVTHLDMWFAGSSVRRLCFFRPKHIACAGWHGVVPYLLGCAAVRLRPGGRLKHYKPQAKNIPRCYLCYLWSVAMCDVQFPGDV
jgi:hypothetical protein